MSGDPCAQCDYMGLHCGRCICCRPLSDRKPHKGGRGGGATSKEGCSLWTFAPVIALAILTAVICLCRGVS